MQGRNLASLTAPTGTELMQLRALFPSPAWPHSFLLLLWTWRTADISLGFFCLLFSPMSGRKDAKLPVRAMSLKDNTGNTSPGSSAKSVLPCFPKMGLLLVEPRWKPAALSSSVSAQVSSPLHSLLRWSLQTERKFSSSFCLIFSFFFTLQYYKPSMYRFSQGHFKPLTDRSSLFLLWLSPHTVSAPITSPQF